MKEMLEEDDRTGGKVLARDFIEHQTEGFEAFAQDIRNESWDRIVESSGISRDLIHQAAQIAIKSERMICSWAMGITQHKNGVGECAEHRELRAAARADRAQGRWCLPGSRPQQCSGRSHGWHLGENEQGVYGGARQGI